jgi:fructose-1,6-bisphosphatase I
MPQIAGTLDAYLDQAAGRDACLGAAARVFRAIAAAAVEMSGLIGLGRLSGQLSASHASTNADGDVQKELDVLANDMFVGAFRQAPVAAVVSEEMTEPLVLDSAGPLAVAMDPLDGSSNIDANVSIGTIFSVLPVQAEANGAEALFLRPGRMQVAAGFVRAADVDQFALGSGQAQIFTSGPSRWPVLTRRYPLRSSNGKRRIRHQRLTTGIGRLRSGLLSTIASRAPKGR